MRKILKILILLSLVFTAVAITVFTSFAEEGTEETLPAFVIYDKDGNVAASGEDQDALQASLSSLNDQDTIVFNEKFEISRKIYVTSAEDAPKTVNIDLNGNILFSMTKTTVFSAGDYTTLNIYSSKEGGVVYVTDDTQGGNVFNILGNSAVINAGEVTVGENTYLGSNLRTFSSCLVDLYPESQYDKLCDANSYFNLTGGTHYSIHSDYSGYIIPRCGEATFNIKDANIITLETRAPINSAGESTTLNMENCRLIQYEAARVKLFNNIVGTVNLTDCITTYYMSSSVSAEDKLTLAGRNVFAVADAPAIDIIVDGDSLVQATTYTAYELTQGLTELNYYDITGSFKPIISPIPDLKDPVIFVDAANTVNYKFVKGEETLEETWSKDEEPTRPYALPIDAVEGVYKYGWKKDIDADGTVIYTVDKIADFRIKVSAVFENEELYFNIYAPINIVDEGYLDFVNVRIQGEEFPLKDWSEVEVDGVRYYLAVTGIITEETVNDIIEIRLPCDYGGGLYVDSTWSFTAKGYVESVLATEEDGVWSVEEYALVREIKDAYLTVNEE